MRIDKKKLMSSMVFVIMVPGGVEAGVGVHLCERDRGTSSGCCCCRDPGEMLWETTAGWLGTQCDVIVRRVKILTVLCALRAACGPHAVLRASS